MARKTKEQALETRNHIIDAAILCFSRQGVSTTTLLDIATEAGVTRGAIYWHFKNKIDLLKTIWLQYEFSLDQMEQEVLSRYPSDPLTQLEVMIITILQSVVINKQQRALMEILYHKCEFVGELVAFQQIQRDFMQTNLPIIEERIHQCKLKQQLPAGLNLRQASVIIRAYVTGIMENWLFSPDSFDLMTESPKLVKALIDMLRLSPALSDLPC